MNASPPVISVRQECASPIIVNVNVPLSCLSESTPQACMFWLRLATFDVYNQITIATWRWTQIILSSDLAITQATWADDKRHMRMKPRRPPMTNAHALLDGTETACRQFHASERHLHAFSKSKHLLGSEVSWCDHRLAQTQKEAFSEVRVLAGTTQVDFEVDRQPPADSPPGDHLITGKGNDKKELQKIEKKKETEIAFDCEIARDCVEFANVVIGLCKKSFARTHAAIHKPTSAQRLSDHGDTHLIIVCGAPRPMGWRGNKNTVLTDDRKIVSRTINMVSVM